VANRDGDMAAWRVHVATLQSAPASLCSKASALNTTRTFKPAKQPLAGVISSKPRALYNASS